jgi:hypothetical protein
MLALAEFVFTKRTSGLIGAKDYVYELNNISSGRYSLVLFDGSDVIQESSLIITK